MSCSRTTTQCRWWGSNPRPLGLKSSTLPLCHWAYLLGKFSGLILKSGFSGLFLNSGFWGWLPVGQPQNAELPVYFFRITGHVAQSVTCLPTDVCLTADPGVASSIPARSHTFVEVDHEIISTVILPFPLIHSRRVVVSYKRKYVHKLLVNRLFKPAQEKVWLSELTVPQWP